MKGTVIDFHSFLVNICCDFYDSDAVELDEAD